MNRNTRVDVRWLGPVDTDWRAHCFAIAMTTEMIRPFGLGPATFGAISVLVICTVLAIAAAQSKGLSGAIGVTLLFAAVFCGLVFWPTHPISESLQETGPADVIFLPRVILLCFLILVLIRTAVEVVRRCLLDVQRAAPVAQRHANRSIR